MIANTVERMRGLSRSEWGTLSFWLWMAFLGGLILAGLYAAVQVFTQGLGITNLSDASPWGLWITIDTSAIALSAGAFSFCALVYILKLEQFKRLARLAAFVGLSGYSVAMLSLLMDLGRPDRFYFGYISWNTHSVLWEVTICIGLYFTVMSIENLPNLARFTWLRTRFPKLAGLLSKTHDYALPLAFIGLFLSILHQSSLGNTYGIIAGRPIWHRPGMAVLFFASAVVGGMAMTLLVASIAAGFRKAWQIGEKAMQQIARGLGWAALLLLAMRAVDLLMVWLAELPGSREGLQLLLSGPFAVNFWAGEIFFGLLVPILILLTPRLRKVPVYRLSAFFLLVGGVVAYRWDTNVVGQSIVRSPLAMDSAPMYIDYVPALVEVVSGVGAIAIGVALISLGLRHLRLLEAD